MEKRIDDQGNLEGRAYTGSFASIYDDIMGAVPYDLWYSYLNELLDYYQLKPRHLLDLACGTGNMSLRFAEKGYRVTGIDYSREMLEVARKKAREAGRDIQFLQADLRDFQLEERYDFAFSLFDSLNYILEAEELKAVFINVYNALVADGYFIFDMNTLKRLMSIRPGTTVFNGSFYTCRWEDIIDREKKRWKVRLKIGLEGEGKEYFEELHQETGYPVARVEELLLSAGFEQVEVFNAYTFERGKDTDNRIYFIAFKDFKQVKKKPWIRKLYKGIKWRLLNLLNL